MYMDMSGVMVKYPYVAGPDMVLLDARIYMRECDIRHLPVVEKDKIVGVLSDRDLKQNIETEKNKTIREVMTLFPFVVHQDESLAHCVHMMAEHKYGSVLITNDEGLLVGIFTTTDALKLLEQFLQGDPEFFKKDSTIILKEVVSWS